MGILDRFRRKLTPDRFAELLSARIKAAGDTREVIYDPENFYLSTADGGAITNLHNLYAEYQRAEQAKTARRWSATFLAAWFTTEMELPESLDDAKARPAALAPQPERTTRWALRSCPIGLEPNEQLAVRRGGRLPGGVAYLRPADINPVALGEEDLNALGRDALRGA